MQTAFILKEGDLHAHKFSVKNIASKLRIQLICSSLFSAQPVFKIFTYALLLFVNELKVTNLADYNKIYACWEDNSYNNSSEQ